MIIEALRDDLYRVYPDLPKRKTLNEELLCCVEQQDGKPFIFIIDEWDAMIREAKDDAKAQGTYLNLLRGWFKNNSFTPKVVAAAYMTGILPIKKDGSQSVISEFDESSMLDTLEFADFVGFTKEEVQERCKSKNIDFEEIKAWYDGYDLPSAGSVYNPYSVMKAFRSGKCQSYWRKTSAAESLKNYINMDFEGLQQTVARLISGEKIPVNVDLFQNDFENFASADDVLTLLVHLGYLTYHVEEKTVQIPNEEVRIEFKQFLSQTGVNSACMKLIKRSQKILEDTLNGKADDVVDAMTEIRGEQYAPQYYNNEQSLRAIIKYAYLTTVGQCIKVEEMPSRKGLADVVFIPAPLSRLPVMVIELKWNELSGGAIEQIKERRYPEILNPYKGDILLVGMNYDAKTGVHQCKIEKYPNK